MASDPSQRRIERLLDDADEAVAHLDWETVHALLLSKSGHVIQLSKTSC